MQAIVEKWQHFKALRFSVALMRFIYKKLSMTRFRWRRAVPADRLQDGYRSIVVFLLRSRSIAVLVDQKLIITL